MKFDSFQGINPTFWIEGSDGRDRLYMLRLDWILVLGAMAVVAVLVG